MGETKPFEISKQAVKLAFEKVKENKGAEGIDKQSIKEYEKDLKNNLYKLWNRMSSGTYFPKPVRAVEIPKKSGGTRILGIPTVEDRIAQMVVKLYFEPGVEKIFYEDSYGYRPSKSALEAIGVVRERCWRKEWVVEFDIKGLFDNIRHDYLMEIVKRHTEERWIALYIERWLKVSFIKADGTTIERKAGTPQGGVISPVLANLFMHYVFDEYMSRNYEGIPWVRYADDGVAHCSTQRQAEYLVRVLDRRFKQYGIELNKEKTRIIHCQRKGGQKENIQFGFLGYTFKPRKAKYNNETFTGYLPAISNKAQKAIRKEIKSWKLQQKVSKTIEEIAERYNSKIQGWINYYGKYYKTEMDGVLRYINRCLLKWVRKKYKKRTTKQAVKWLKGVATREKDLFAHWKFGISPTVW